MQARRQKSAIEGTVAGVSGRPRAGKTNLILGLFRQKSMLLKRGVEISTAKP